MSLDIIVWFLAAAAVFSFVERKFLKHEANDWWKSIECHKVENTYLIFMRVFALNLLKNDDHAVHWNRWIHSIAKWHDTERHFFSIQLYRWIIPFSFCSLIIFIVKTKISICSTHTHTYTSISHQCLQHQYHRCQAKYNDFVTYLKREKYTYIRLL